jgi:hypothetical protein
MPKSPAVAGTAVPKVVHDDDVPVSHLDLLRARADRLARAAVESCRQHERCAEIVERDGVDPAELEGWLELTGVADRLLGEATAAYEKASAKLKAGDDDLPWRRKANVLWLAAREHVRRHTMGDRLTRRVGAAHTVDRLGELHVAFELEASAILSLRQAAESYCHARPEAREPGGQGR